MNKKFLSAILFGALMVTSTGTFVSCKDYDDEIDNLQEQIDKKADLTELSSQVSSMQSAISAAQSEAAKALDAAKKADDSAKIAALEAKLDALETCKCDVDALKAELKETIDGAIADADLDGLKKQIEDQMAVVEELAGEYLTMVTSVSLYTAANQSEVGTQLVFEKITEKANTFPASATAADKQYTFTAGNSLTKTDDIIVRVSPTTAILKAENIALINSKGEELTEFVYVDKVEAYNPETPLYTPVARSAANNGLWKVTFKLKENYNAAAFEAATIVSEDDVKLGDIQFAFAVNNTTAEEGAAARRVISSYDLTVGTSNGNIAANSFLVNGVSIETIHNRYSACEDNTSTTNVQELSWLDDTKPSTTAILTGDDKNAANRPENGDDRQEDDILPVVKGEPIKIQIDWNADENEANNLIKGFYVTLDKNYALESVPSEINAWNSYEYENVGTDKVAAKLIDGNEGTITIKNLNNVVGDIIGFRVYAVNLDGTLLDPDGRAFYVSVGNPAAAAQTITATITPETTEDNTVTVELTSTQSSVITNLLKNQTNDPSIVMATTNPVLKVADVTYASTYTVDYTWNDDETAVVKATFTLNDVANFIDNKTYKASIEYKNATQHVLGTVNFELTKAMPTAFPEDFAFRPKQEVEDGTGKFIAYMIPENGYAVETASENGVKDMNNVFYGLDKDYQFIFADSEENDDDELIDVEVVAADEDEVKYELEVAKAFIDNTEWHNVTVNYLYRGISTYYDAEEEDYVRGVDFPVAYANTLQVMYSCWEDASKFAWGTEEVDDEEKSLKPELQWTAEGEGDEADLAAIISTNSYNNDYFGLNLNELMEENGWLRLATADDDVEEPVKLVVNNQVNPYFVPAIDGDKITFTQESTQVDAAPTADHEETLVISVVDAYGHVTEISLAVTVKAPEKK